MDSKQIVTDLEAKIRGLEARLNRFECQEATGAATAKDSSNSIYNREHERAPTDTADEIDEPARQFTVLTNKNTIPEVRTCNFMHFMNRFNSTDGFYAVDVLKSGYLLEQEITDEFKFREKRAQYGSTRKYKTKVDAATAIRENADALVDAQIEDSWIRRIRIQSPALLKILSRIQGEAFATRSRTYHSPFADLIYFHPKVKERLEELEAQYGHVLDQKPTEQDKRHDPSMGEDDNKPESQAQHRPLLSEGLDPSRASPSASGDDDIVDDSVDDCPAALASLRAYVKFIDEEVMPEYKMFENKDWSSKPEETEVWFSDLWYLFRNGETIHRPLGSNFASIGQRELRVCKTIWRVYGIKDADAQWRHAYLDHRKYDSQEPVDDSKDFVVRAFYIEYTGEEFCIVPKSFTIPPYQGARPINSLPVYPIRFAVDWEKSWESSTSTGAQVLHYIDAKHGSYNAWTITRTPAGDTSTDANGVPLKHAEHINSEVMVDFNEAFQACQTWKPRRSILRPDPVSKSLVTDEFPVLWWSDDNRTQLLTETSDLITVRSGVSTWDQNEYITKNRLLARISDNDSRGEPTTKRDLERYDLPLITSRVFAYVFQERKFAQLDVRKIQPATGSREALNALKIDPWAKHVIQESIKGHLLQRAAEREHGEEQQTLDLIQGKGGGLFILLHGVPGVGKTATAEAIALANRKPLFRITCGDLGLTPDQVETSLRGIFRLASLWDCILLMDEVDTFFSQRTKGEAAITRNALVSVFLRILDYYTGILFLTTNRPGVLDEAFKSRIHCKIFYPPLTKRQTNEIWRNNIQRLRKIEEEQGQRGEGTLRLDIDERGILAFADEQFEKNSKSGYGQWNGRQIRNAFQVARSLAYTDAARAASAEMRVSHEGPAPPISYLKLDVQHFEMMGEITESFEKYMMRVRGNMSDTQLAEEAEVRVEHFPLPQPPVHREAIYESNNAIYYSGGRMISHEAPPYVHGHRNGGGEGDPVSSWSRGGSRAVIRDSIGSPTSPSVGGGLNIAPARIAGGTTYGEISETSNPFTRGSGSLGVGYPPGAAQSGSRSPGFTTQDPYPASRYRGRSPSDPGKRERESIPTLATYGGAPFPGGNGVSERHGSLPGTMATPTSATVRYASISGRHGSEVGESGTTDGTYSDDVNGNGKRPRISVSDKDSEYF